jgi:tRNA modification GTPase
MDTIVAVSSPPGPGARAVVRLSGKDARAIVQQVWSGALESAATAEYDPSLGRIPNHRAVLRGNFDDSIGELPGFLFWMPGPASYTREDVIELHLPGAPPLIDAALARLFALGARLAEPGEFTRRAFLNGRLDLTRAEGVLGLIEASDRAAQRSASKLLVGGLGTRIQALREGLDNLRALAEASLDFDTAETGHVDTTQLQALATDLESALREALTWEERREPSKGRPRVVLAGRPNAGKSSLFNRLTASVRMESTRGAASASGKALVSDLAGSTRDGVSGLWRIFGVDVELMDAPGFDAVHESAEADSKAQELAFGERSGADLLLWAVAPQDANATRLAKDAEQLANSGNPALCVLTKDDLREPRSDKALRQLAAAAGLDISSCIAISSESGTGLPELESLVGKHLGITSTGSAPAQAVVAAAALGRELSARHRTAIRAALAALDEARGALADQIPLDLVAETLREATDELDAVTGETTSEDLLDRIFAGFCLGK